MSRDDWWWWPGGAADRGPGATGARPVLFFPPAGADQTIATPLVPLLAGVRFGVLRMPGRGVRRHEPAPQRIEDVVTGVADSVVDLGGPAPMLVGHSFGGLLAFGVAQELERRARTVGRLVAVASTPPHAWADHLASLGTDDPQEYVARRVRQLLADGAVPREVADHPELGAAVRASLADDVRMSHGRADLTVLRCPVTSVVARDDRLVARDAVRRWALATTGEFEELVVRGEHFFYRREPARLAGLLRGELDALDGAYSHS